MFTEIKNRKQFERVSSTIKQKGINADYIFDCGSSTKEPEAFLTSQFKRHLSITSFRSALDRMSKCIGVETDVDIVTEAQYKAFTIPNLSSDMPMSQTGYFIFLLNLHDKGNLDTLITVNRTAYLISVGYEPGTHTLNEEQVTTLRHIHDYFYSSLGRLDEFRAPDSINAKGATEKQLEALGVKVIKEPQPKTLSVEDELALLSINGNRLELPKAKLQHYNAIKTKLSQAGGKYKKLGFEFPATVDLEKLMILLCGGQKVNIKKEYQFFETPESEVDDLIADADIQANDKWLEPSAGKAAIAKKLGAISNNGTLVELMDDNFSYLSSLEIGNLHHKDFLACNVDELNGPFDKIVANPPFSKNQDIKHFVHMTEMLKEDGRVACVTSDHWKHSSTQLCAAFREWLNESKAKVTKIEQGAFKSSGTNIATNRIVLNKSDIKTSFNDFLAAFTAKQAA